MLPLGLCVALGCGPSDPSDPNHPLGTIDLLDVASVQVEGQSATWGYAVAAGADLDGDGVEEWVASEVPWGFEHGAVRVHERGAEQLPIEPGPRGSLRLGWQLEAGFDTDGDGRPELLGNDYWLSEELGPWLKRSTEPSDDIRFNPPYPLMQLVSGLAFAPRPDGLADVLVFSQRWNNGAHLRIDRFDVSGVAPGTVMPGDDDTLVFERDFDVGLSSSEPFVADVDDDGTNELLFGRWDRNLDAGFDGEVWVCHGERGIDPDEDCDVFTGEALGMRVGRSLAAGRLADGTLVLLTSANGAEGDDGGFVVFTLDGNVRARVHGTRQVRFGNSLTVVADAQGADWVYVGDLDYYEQHDTNQLYRFSLDALSGELTDLDAHTTWTTGHAAVLGAGIAPYRATPEERELLVVSEPYYEAGTVYVFDPWLDQQP